MGGPLTGAVPGELDQVLFSVVLMVCVSRHVDFIVFSCSSKGVCPGRLISSVVLKVCVQAH